jgi:hypothetical protein
MTIPEGWKITSRDQILNTQTKGKEAIEEATGQALVIGEFKNLLHLQKDEFNVFQSTIEPSTAKEDGDRTASNEALKQAVMSAYTNKEIRFDVSDTKIEAIDGVKFAVYEFTLYAPNGDVLLRQIMYSTLINGYDFGMSISTNNDQSRDAILSAWRKSKFVKKHN